MRVTEKQDGGGALPAALKAKDKIQTKEPTQVGVGQVAAADCSLPLVIRTVDWNLTGFAVLLVFNFTVYS